MAGAYQVRVSLEKKALDPPVARPEDAADPDYQPEWRKIVSGNFLEDPIPKGHDTFIVANVVHTLTADQNRQLVRRVREAAGRGARLLLVDLWTNPTHTEPQIAALLAGEFLVIAGNGDVYSTEDAMTRLVELGWSFVEQKPLDGPVSVIVAEADNA